MYVEGRDSQYLYNLINIERVFEFVFDHRYNQICTYSNPDVDVNGIFRMSPQGFDSQVLFYPFEKRFYLPSMAIKSRDFK